MDEHEQCGILSGGVTVMLPGQVLSGTNTKFIKIMFAAYVVLIDGLKFERHVDERRTPELD